MRHKSAQNRSKGGFRNVMGEVASVIESWEGVNATGMS
jgi:hypothetical protein